MKNNTDSHSRRNGSLKFLEPLETPTAQEMVYKELSQAIISGKISPGTRIVTSEVAKALNVSQAPVRGAMNYLKAKGFIRSKKNKACVVRELTGKELKEIIHIRLILETFAVELSYMVCTKETLMLSEKILQRAEKAKSWEEYDQLNTAFHQMLYQDAQMPLLLHLISDLCDKVSPYVILYYSSKGKHNDYHTASEHKYHRGMLEGMRRKDLKAVLKNLEQDLSKRTASLDEILDRRETVISEKEKNL